MLAGSMRSDVSTKHVNRRELTRGIMSVHYLPTLGRAQKSNTLRAYGENVYDVIAYLFVYAGEIKEVLSTMLSRGSV
jgi:hypothetical protein